MDGETVLMILVGGLVFLGIPAALIGGGVWIALKFLRRKQSSESAPAQEPEALQETPDMSSPTPSPRPEWKLKALEGHEALLRFAVVVIIGLCMLIPLDMIDQQAQERGELRQEATRNIAQTWGEMQVVGGPSVIVPVTRRERRMVSDKDGGGREVVDVVEDKLFILPRSLTITSSLLSEIRTRGIYEAVVYTAPITLSGDFDLTQVSEFLKAHATLTPHWENAYFSFGITHTASLRDVQPLQFNRQAFGLAPGTGNTKVFPQGFHAALAGVLEPGGRYPFSMELAVKGSEGIRFLPLGETNSFALKSAWPHPSFQGNALPDQHQISDTGFDAQWAIPNLARSYQQVSLISEWEADINQFQVGVDLFEPVRLYGEILRATKYGILFIALTFALFLANELRSTSSRLHPVQYGMVGLAMSLFYLLLLALAEHIPFLFAYLAASAVVVVMNGAYVGAVLRSWGRGARLAFGLALLYALLYVVLRMEDYSLLMGTGLTLATVGMLMHGTRKLGQADGK